MAISTIPQKERNVKKSTFALLAVLAFVGTSNPTNAATLHVWQASPSPGPPYGDWATAAHTIQDGVDAAVDGDTVFVMGGVYSTGGRAVVGLMTNRVAIDKAIRVESVSGPGETLIVGAKAPGGGTGDGPAHAYALWSAVAGRAHALPCRGRLAGSARLRAGGAPAG